MKWTDTLVRPDTKYGDVVGIEIELEHQDDPTILPEQLDKGWRIEHDGSLRVNGLEYVLRRPMKLAVALSYTNLLGKHIDATNNVIDAGRAGIHVHINVGDLTIKQFINFVSLAHILDNLFANWCGEKRNGNLFCLKLSDASYVVEKIEQALQAETLDGLYDDDIRYSSVNLKSVVEYGSVEFRSLNSDGNWENISIFAKTLMRLKDVARRLDNPTMILRDFSMKGDNNFVEEILGEMAVHFPKYKGWEQDLIDNVRRVQWYAFGKDW